MTKRTKAIQGTKVFKQLKKIVDHAEQEWRKRIKDEKNPVLKMILQDQKDIIDMQAKFDRLHAMYGIEVWLTAVAADEGGEHAMSL